MSRLLEALRAHALSRPDAVALVDGEFSLGYAEVLRRVQDLSRMLIDRQCRRLGLLADNGVAWALTDLATDVAGIAIVPLPTFFSDQQLTHALRSAGVDLVVSDRPERLARLFGAAAGAPTEFCGHLQCLSLDAAGSSAVAMPAATRKLTFTSGTTGEPKGVCLGLDQIERVADALREASAARPDDRHLCVLPLATLLENVAGIHVPLLAGASVLVPPLSQVGLNGSSGHDSRRLLRALDEGEITSAIMVPQMLAALVAAIAAGAPVPGRLRYLAVGGAPISPRLIAQAIDLGLPVHEGYGLSECGSVVAVNRPGDNRVGSVGKPLPHVRLAFAEDGEILVAGNTFLGYLGGSGRCEAGAGAEAKTKTLATGDLGHLDADGHLHITGRKKNMFITSFGRNVAPEWVERELALSGGIAQAAVFGEGRPFNAAVIVPRPGCGAADVGRALAIANAELPDYAQVRAWIPARDAFTAGNGLLTANGRLRRQPILQLYGDALSSLYRKECHDVLC